MNPIPLTTLLATDIPQPETDWLIPNLLPLGLTLLLGQPRIGKSWLALHLALSIARGDLALDSYATRQTDVLYLGLQDNPHRMCTRVRNLLTDQPAPANLIWTNQWILSTSSSPIDTTTALDLWLTAHPQTRLIVIDSLDQLLTSPSHRRTSISPQQELTLVHQLKVLADQHHIAILLLTQLPPKASRRPLHDLMYTPTVAIADTLLLLKRDRGQADATLFLTSTDLPDQELALRLPPDTLRWTLLGPASDYHLSQQRRDILDLLQEHHDSPLSPKDIASLLHKDRRAITKLLFDMTHASQIRLVGHGQYMALNSNHDLPAQHTPAPSSSQPPSSLIPNISNSSNHIPANTPSTPPSPLDFGNSSNHSNQIPTDTPFTLAALLDLENISNHSNQTPTNTPSTLAFPLDLSNIGNHSNQPFTPIDEHHFLSNHLSHPPVQV